MRWLSAILTVLAPVIVARAEPVRVLAWNMEWFPSGSPRLATVEIEKQRLAQAAAVLRTAAADILVLEEIRDLQTGNELAAALGGTYQLVVCSNFRDAISGAPSWQQIAIIARRSAKAAWAEAWKTRGAVDPPRGFAFACFEIHNRVLAIYGVHLKSNLRSEDPRTNQLNILKRELAARQLLDHQSGAEARIGAPFDAIVIAGDFNTTRDDLRFASEATLRLLEGAGFATQLGGETADDRITLPAKGKYPAVTFDYIFLHGGAWVDPVTVLRAPLSDHRAITAVIELADRAVMPRES